MQKKDLNETCRHNDQPWPSGRTCRRHMLALRSVADVGIASPLEGQGSLLVWKTKQESNRRAMYVIGCYILQTEHAENYRSEGITDYGENYRMNTG